jgi:hypothetical protein
MEKQGFTYQGVEGKVSPLLDAPIESIADAKRTLGRLILGFQQGTINSQDAKTMCYLLISFSAMCRDNDLEERIKTLEEKAGSK